MRSADARLLWLLLISLFRGPVTAAVTASAVAVTAASAATALLWLLFLFFGHHGGRDLDLPRQ